MNCNKMAPTLAYVVAANMESSKKWKRLPLVRTRVLVNPAVKKRPQETQFSFQWKFTRI